MNSSAARMPSVTGRQLLPIGGVMNTVHKTRNWSVASLLLALSIPGTLLATTGTWTGGAGATWNTTAGNWSGVSGTPWDSSNGANNIADFNTAGATVNVNAVYANGITFDSTTVLTNGTINLVGTTPTITVNANASNACTLAATSGFSQSGSSSATNTLTKAYTGGTITINGGVLNMADAVGDSFNPSTKSIVINNGGTLYASGGNGFGNDVVLTINSGGTYFCANSDSLGGITGSGTMTTANNGPVATFTLPSNLTFDGLLTGVARVQVVNNSSLTTAGTPRTFTLTNPNNNNTANNLIGIGGDSTDAGNVGDCTLKLGASEVITDNIQLRLNGNKAASGAGSYQNALDMNGYNETIAGLTYGAVQATGTKPGLVTNSAATTSTLTLNVASAMSTNFYGIIAGNIALTKAGVYTQALYGANTYTGNTTINAGTLLVNSPGSLGASAVTVANGGTLGGNGTVNGNVTVATGGTLSGTGPYNGAVTVASGGFLSPNANAYGLTTFGNAGASALTLNGSVLPFDLNAATTPGTTYDQIAITGTLVLNGASTIFLNFPSGTAAVGTYTLMTYAAKTGSGSLALDKTYPNASLTVGATSVTLTVSGSPTYVGGDVWKGPATGPWDTATANWTKNGTAGSTYAAGDVVIFDDSDTTASSYTITGTVASTTGTTPASVTVNNWANSYVLSTPLAGNMSLTKNGTGSLTLSPTLSKSVTTVNGSAVVAMTDTTGVQLGMGLSGTGIPGSSYIIAINSGVSVTISANATANGSITATVSGNVFTGNTTINGGYLVVDGTITGNNMITNSPTGLGNVTFNNAVTFRVGGNYWYANTFTLNGTLTLADNFRSRVDFKALDLGGGARTIYVNGKSTAVTGGNTISSEGTGNNQWEILGATSWGNTTNPVVQNGTLDLETTAFTGANYGAMRFQTTINWTADLIIGGNVLVLSEANAFGSSAATSPNVTVNSGGIWDLTAVGCNVKSLAGGGAVFGSMLAANSAAKTLTENGTSGSTDFSGVISDGPGTGALSLSKTGGSTQTLSGASTYSGGTTNSSGTIAVGGNQALGTGPVVIAGGALAAASGGGTLSNVINMVSNAIFDTTSGNLTLAGSITNRGAITKTGSNSLIINGTLTDTNTLTVSAGILAGTGTLAGTVSNSAAIMAGPDTNTVGTLTVSNLVMNSGSSYNWKYNASSYDTITANGTLTLPAVATVNVSRVSGTTLPPNPAVLFSAASAPTINGATTLSGWVITGALPSTKVRVVGNQVIMTSSKGCVFYVN